MTTTNEPVTIHRFERAGLGKAPFNVIGSYESKYQAIPGDPSCPIQPGTCCDYCAQSIMQVYEIKSADGKTFKVGCDCVAKTSDKALTDSVRRIKNAASRERNAAKAVSDRVELSALLADETGRGKLALVPHSRSDMAASGYDLLDEAEWMLSHAGAAGRKKVLGLVRAAIGQAE